MGPLSIDCWLEAETALGFRTFYAGHLSAVRRVVAIRGPSAPILDSIAKTYTDQGRRVVKWHAVHSRDGLRGVVVPQRQTAWVAEELFEQIPAAAGPEPERMIVGPNPPFDPRLAELKSRLRKCLAAALTALNEWESGFDAAAAWDRSLTDAWCARWLQSSKTRPGRARHYFGSPLTPQGPDLSFLSQRFSRLETTVHLRGTPSASAGQALRRFGDQAILRGYSVDIYHDSLDPSRIDHLVVPELSLGLTHARPPHDLAEGRSALWPLGQSVLANPESERWWNVFQDLYVQSWHIMEDIQAVARQTLPACPAELSRIVKACTA